MENNIIILDSQKRIGADKEALKMSKDQDQKTAQQELSLQKDTSHIRLVDKETALRMEREEQGRWMTVSEFMKEKKLPKTTVWNKIKQGKYIVTYDDKKYNQYGYLHLIWVPQSIPKSIPNDAIPSQSIPKSIPNGMATPTLPNGNPDLATQSIPKSIPNDAISSQSIPKSVPNGMANQNLPNGKSELATQSIPKSIPNDAIPSSATPFFDATPNEPDDKEQEYQLKEIIKEMLEIKRKKI